MLKSLETSLDAEIIVKISTKNKQVKGIVADAYIELLKRHNYNVSALIKYLKIPRQSLYNKIRDYGIDLKWLRDCK